MVTEGGDPDDAEGGRGNLSDTSESVRRNEPGAGSVELGHVLTYAGVVIQLLVLLAVLMGVVLLVLVVQLTTGEVEKKKSSSSSS